MSEDNESENLITLPRVMIVGTNRGVGTSTITLGSVVTFRKNGVGVGTAKLGCWLAEPTHHRRVMGRLAYTLDPWLLSTEQILSSLLRLSGSTEIAVFEGTGGPFDDLGADSSFRSWCEMAKALATPIVLVVDARGYAESIAAHIQGFMKYESKVPIAGVIANRVSGPDHSAQIAQAVESSGGPVYLGGVPIGDPHQTGGTLVGLHMYNPSALTRNRVIGTGNLIEEHVDMTALREIAGKSRKIRIDIALPNVPTRICKVAVADDQAFHLTVQDNLDLIRRAGGELVAFSPIADRKLPSGVSAVYFPGGYTQLYAADLNANRPMLQALKDFVAAGGVLYAEAGALAYLSKKLTLFNGTSYEMAGIIPGTSTAIIDDADRPTVVQEKIFCSSENIAMKKGTLCRGFRDNRWALRLETKVSTCFDVQDRNQDLVEQPLTLQDGFMPVSNVLATRSNIHWGSCPGLAEHFIQSAAKVGKKT